MKALAQLAMQLEAVQKFLGIADLPVQQVLTFIHVPGTAELPMADLAELTNASANW